MRNLVLGTSLVVMGACGPSERTGNGLRPDGSTQTTDDSMVVQPPPSRVYAHSGSKLYQVNTQTFAPAEIGTMAGLGTQSLTDLAIDKNDNMIGITLDKLYELDASSGAATLLTDLSVSARGLTSLSFVPENVNNAGSADILVAANDDGDVFEIDPVNGTATTLGNFGMHQGQKIRSSGDLIGVRGFGIFATVNVGDNKSALDFLARIDPDNNWQATVIGNTGFNDIFGLAYWDGVIYGFVSAPQTGGKIITISQTTGAGTEVLSGAINWFGAGVATDAPILQ